MPSNSITSSAKSQYDLFSYEIYMQIRMLLFNELSLEFICKNPSNENNSYIQHTLFGLSFEFFLGYNFYVVSLTQNPIRFQVK